MCVCVCVCVCVSVCSVFILCMCSVCTACEKNLEREKFCAVCQSFPLLHKITATDSVKSSMIFALSVRIHQSFPVRVVSVFVFICVCSVYVCDSCLCLHYC